MDTATNQLDPTIISNIEFFVVDAVADIAVPVFFYGTYAVLYGTCMVILRQKRTQYHRLYTTAMTVLFVLASFGVVVNVFLATRGVIGLIVGEITESPPSEEAYSQLLTFSVISFFFYILSNMVADTLLLIRCYHIWNRLVVVLFPAILCLVCNGLGIVAACISFQDAVHGSTSDTKLLVAMDDHIVGRQPLLLTFLGLDLLSNLLLTSVIAVKLLFVIRHARRAEVKSVQALYTSVMAIIVESGLLYPIGLVALLIFSNNAVTYSLIHIVGISPTLIIVRIGLGTALHVERGCLESIN
ncbi:hypothetical protein E1B28_008967 [Marasmius oreades]|uniref:Uncharacterized protein n=1 Tax=Marasmius oreades TaxID=181124 RepID=A0A9P7RZI3_9AGAR|nr:uncharacterized protein E1B28_008967 [Marasmius oreades]KAG7092624.1 hypothetical protein E1B28_008967 [Marasmius oreades]